MEAGVGNALTNCYRLVNRGAMAKFTKPENLENKGCKESLCQLQD